jgi:hypothetical protein
LNEQDGRFLKQNSEVGMEIMNAFLAQASEFVCRFYRASSIQYRASSIKLNKHNKHIS